MSEPARRLARHRLRGSSGVGLALVALAVLLHANSAAAGDDDVRVFVGAVGLYGLLVTAEDDFDNDTVATTQVGYSPGGALVIGAQLPNGLSFDFDTEYVLGHEFEQETALGTVSDDLWMLTFSSNFGYHPIDSFIDPYVSLGLGLMHAELADFGAGGTGVTTRAAAGVNFWFGPVGLRAEARYLYPLGGELKDLDSAAARAGVLFRF